MTDKRKDLSVVLAEKSTKRILYSSECCIAPSTIKFHICVRLITTLTDRYLMTEPWTKVILEDVVIVGLYSPINQSETKLSMMSLSYSGRFNHLSCSKNVYFTLVT